MVLGVCGIAGEEVYRLVTHGGSEALLTAAGVTIVLSYLVWLLGIGDERAGERGPARTRPVLELVASAALAIGTGSLLARGVSPAARFGVIAGMLAGVIGAVSAWRRMRAARPPH